MRTERGGTEKERNRDGEEVERKELGGEGRRGSGRQKKERRELGWGG